MPEHVGSSFISDAVRADLAEGRFTRVATRFPPEPTDTCISAMQSGFDQLRHRAGVRRNLQPEIRRHESGQRGTGVHRRHPGKRAVAWRRLGTRLFSPPTISGRCMSGRSS